MKGRARNKFTLDHCSNLNSIHLDETLSENVYGTNVHDRDKVIRTRTKILDPNSSNEFLTNSFNFSTCGQLEFEQSNNHLNITSSTAGSIYFTYNDRRQVSRSTAFHSARGRNLEVNANTRYDHAGRVRNEELQINNGDITTLNEFTYDARGNVVSKKQGDTYGRGRFDYLQKLDYQYLDNGLLEAININGLANSSVKSPTWNGASTNRIPTVRSSSPSSLDQLDLFHLQLYRDEIPSVHQHHVLPARKNGDITYVASQVLGRRQQVWGIAYDDYDRMVEARWYERS